MVNSCFTVVNSCLISSLSQSRLQSRWYYSVPREPRATHNLYPRVITMQAIAHVYARNIYRYAINGVVLMSPKADRFVFEIGMQRKRIRRAIAPWCYERCLRAFLSKSKIRYATRHNKTHVGLYFIGLQITVSSCFVFISVEKMTPSDSFVPVAERWKLNPSRELRRIIISIYY